MRKKVAVAMSVGGNVTLHPAVAFEARKILS